MNKQLLKAMDLAEVKTELKKRKKELGAYRDRLASFREDVEQLEYSAERAYGHLEEATDALSEEV